MLHVTAFAVHLAHDEAGASAIEYGLIAGLVSIVIIGALVTMGDSINTVFTTIGDALNTALNG